MTALAPAAAARALEVLVVEEVVILVVDVGRAVVCTLAVDTLAIFADGHVVALMASLMVIVDVVAVAVVAVVAVAVVAVVVGVTAAGVVVAAVVVAAILVAVIVAIVLAMVLDIVLNIANEVVVSIVIVAVAVVVVAVVVVVVAVAVVVTVIDVAATAGTDQTGRVARVAFERALGSNFLKVPTGPLFLTVE